MRLTLELVLRLAALQQGEVGGDLLEGDPGVRLLGRGLRHSLHHVVVDSLAGHCLVAPGCVRVWVPEEGAEQVPAQLRGSRHLRTAAISNTH